jgi:hypothetical protein
VVVRNRTFDQCDLVLIRRMIRDNPAWGRTRLSQKVCEVLDWFQANGRPKERACRVALSRLEVLGYLSLPTRKVQRGGRPPIAPSDCQACGEPILNMPSRVVAEEVVDKAAARVWNGLVACHHYLGLATPVGRAVRYLLYGDGHLLGAISFSECAWQVAARDQALKRSPALEGITRDDIIANNRYLVLPWVNVPNLASRLLGVVTRRVAADWEARYCVRPKLAETFVDPERFRGTCYRAAGWIEAGTTRGYAKRGSSHEMRRAPKTMFLRGLTEEVQRSLICEGGRRNTNECRSVAA